VVVVLSKEYISTQYPMEELQLLLHWRKQGSKAKLLPVFFDLDYDGLSKTAGHYNDLIKLNKEQVEQLEQGKSLDGLVETVKSMLQGGLVKLATQWKQDLEFLQTILPVMKDNGRERLEQWVRDLAELRQITGALKDQVL
jgi:hypothetical protein